ncbi:methionine biosynthesis protein MetW [Oceanidesulfovibrio indonesiensis]|uniref:Methionine biosynthesis protein MetW n=1 Tax=Oceanidesulfovibrio indonesiensis TaxID=54767 RepID=A0A7M3MF40_9BACT|nr:methionine biosynthesis protein MetW [Oceanidesulfovibrio indonesiensis]TVM17172.1 methionine biosynthesis protein MetW [Oceanidesulfovibrio indonesiensis]
MRFDLQVIASWVPAGSKVLDLGCGTGSLLEHLVREKHVTGRGIEMDEAKVAKAIGRGLSVVQGDLVAEVMDYPSGFFDVVILSQTLQQVYYPEQVIREMLRVGTRCIVSFPNFSHWRIRSQILFTGRAPVTRELPHEWHDTPNIRVLTLKDFRRFCQEMGFVIEKQVALDTDYRQEHGHALRLFANWRALYGIFLLGKGQ